MLGKGFSRMMILFFIIFIIDLGLLLSTYQDKNNHTVNGIVVFYRPLCFVLYCMIDGSF